MVVSKGAPALLGIGALSRASGVPVETIRTWERRHGFPVPVRVPSGHRRYTLDTVDQLRLVRRALDAGHRAASVVGAAPTELRRLLAQSGIEPIDSRESGSTPAPARIDGWIDRVRAFDGAGLEQAWLLAWETAGAETFVLERAVPFLAEIGARWKSKDLSVAHEHFASEKLRDFLVARWRPLSLRAGGPLILCATLPEEQHTLGLHLAAVLITLAGLRVAFLGASTPIDDIAKAAQTSGAAAVLIASSGAADDSAVKRQLGRLHRRLPETIEVAVGGVERAPNGVTLLASLGEVASWAEHF